jgi:glycine cleavage system protein P-like pyridoxal-binding family
VGSNDVGYVKPTDLVRMIKTDMSTVKEMYPDTMLIYNEILSRINWRGAINNTLSVSYNDGLNDNNYIFNLKRTVLIVSPILLLNISYPVSFKWMPSSLYNDVLILYVGSNDVGYVKPTDLVRMIKTDMSTIKEMYPDTMLIYNEILSRINWRGAPNNEHGEHQRITINKYVKPVMESRL